MIKRVIDISEKAYLHILNKQLCVDKDGVTVAKIAVDDLGVLILDNPAIVVTQRYSSGSTPLHAISKVITQ